jgi:CRP/FNR family transcriptional regulator, cyclic AMP receptor protein
VTSLSPAQKHRFLSESPFFSAFTQSELDRLAARLVERRVADRQMIFARGEPGASMLAVVEGRVRIGITSATGRELLLGIVQPGQIFGELALLDGRPRSADASALGACLLLSLDRREFLSAVRQSPDTAIRLAEIVCARLRAADDQLEGVALLSVPARLARLLLAHEAAAQGAGRTDVFLSQGDLGQRIGACRQKVNLHLGRWLAEGVLARQGQALVIRDRDRLAAIADEAEEIVGPCHPGDKRAREAAVGCRA